MQMHMTPRDIALILLAAGVLSIVLAEPLARLDRLVVKGGPHAIEQRRHRHARGAVEIAGVALVVLALALVTLH